MTKKAGSDSNEDAGINEDIFRLIEKGYTSELGTLLNLHKNANLNRSTITSARASAMSVSNAGSQLITQEDDAVSLLRTSGVVGCMREDRHFSALVFACYTNQLECLRLLFEHGQKMTN